jgi:PKD repeat protein
LTEIKSDVKETVKAFIQTLVSIIVKEATKKMIKSLTEREKKKLESTIKDMSDDQLAQYLDKNLCFKNALENALKSLNYTHSAKGTASLTDKLQSIFEETSTRKPISVFNWPALHTVPAILIGILLLSTIAVPAVFPNNSDNNTSFDNNASFDNNTTSYPNNFTITLPVANFSSSVTNGFSPLTVQFNDSSTNATSLNWDFGDGNNSVERNPVHTYFAKGNYTVNLTANNGNGTNSTNAIITVLEKPILRGSMGPSRPSEKLAPDPVPLIPPVANFNANVTSGYAPLTVQFTDLSENVTGLNWNFGDGNSSTEQNPMHTYPIAGNYTVNLTANNGNDTNSKTIPINVINIPEQPVLPVANFNADVTNGVAPLAVQFTDLSTNATSWTWNFGDGQTSSAQNPINTYYSAGTYTVSLTASNANGSNISRKSNLITVDKITPTITWNNPVDITYGTALSGTQLNAIASYKGNPVPGTYVYTPEKGTVLSEGTHILHVDFTPRDTANYSAVSKEVTIGVVPPTRITPIIIWSPEIDYVTYGEVLSDLQLYAYAIDPITEEIVPGQFVYTPPEGTALNEDTQVNISFTPSDIAKYNTASKDVIIHFLKATPTIDWSDPADITYGEPIMEPGVDEEGDVIPGELNAVFRGIDGNLLPGNYSYTPTARTVLSAGTHTLNVDFTPVDTANYTNASENVQINVLKATPTIDWSNPAGIVNGTELNDTQLNAVASVSGSFTYTSDGIPIYIGTVLSEGTHTLHADFTPDDAANYSSASKTNEITVLKTVADLTISYFSINPELPTIADQITFTAVVTNQGNSASSASTVSIKVGRESQASAPRYDIPSLEPGDTYTVTRTQNLNVAQNYVANATADPDSNVDESDESNNQATVTFDVKDVVVN